VNDGSIAGLAQYCEGFGEERPELGHVNADAEFNSRHRDLYADLDLIHSSHFLNACKDARWIERDCGVANAPYNALAQYL